MKFSDALASSIHDIKNSLGMLINTLEEITSDEQSGSAADPRMLVLQSEARRASNDLIQLLSLYKMENERLTPHVSEHNLEDFLDDILVEHQTLAAARGVSMETDCDGFLSAYFDADLLRGLLNNAIGNAERYTENKVLIGAEEHDGYVVIRVEDNGRGFPSAMLDMLKAPQVTDSSEGFHGGRTRLGLFFAAEVARLHRNRDREGFIKLENDCSLGGGCFSVWLP